LFPIHTHTHTHIYMRLPRVYVCMICPLLLLIIPVVRYHEYLVFSSVFFFLFFTLSPLPLLFPFDWFPEPNDLVTYEHKLTYRRREAHTCIYLRSEDDWNWLIDWSIFTFFLFFSIWEMSITLYFICLNNLIYSRKTHNITDHAYFLCIFHTNISFISVLHIFKYGLQKKIN
jgi:hypothetical protein